MYHGHITRRGSRKQGGFTPSTSVVDIGAMVKERLYHGYGALICCNSEEAHVPFIVYYLGAVFKKDTYSPV
ncbi:uncharacterized protein FTJAE_9334 [Fusarium tjaetaba]|uniref:Uncharacterized protein n=1 Tax=Fusarium tjaetaba TaxID=1567544 RepID=A0A8H5R5U5_9HYPO|nr:uncharacterized protein FTJAE_9334 [Fusarium tjaetaba]KAF5627249.1 hypothetical protein FTJAE_9334 [Fusarium tjaetaba]